MAKQYGTPGPRVLDPVLRESDKLGACSIGANLLFDRLHLLADDQGRLRADPLAIKVNGYSRLPSVSAEDIAGWLRELHDNELVTVYQAGPVQCVQITRWWDFQAGQRRAYPSQWAAPSGWEDRVYGLPADRRPGARKVPAQRGRKNGKVRAPEPHLPLPLPVSQPAPSRAGVVTQPSASTRWSAGRGAAQPPEGAAAPSPGPGGDSPPSSGPWGPCPACGATRAQGVVAEVERETCPQHPDSTLSMRVRVACLCGHEREETTNPKPCLRCLTARAQEDA